MSFNISDFLVKNIIVLDADNNVANTDNVFVTIELQDDIIGALLQKVDLENEFITVNKDENSETLIPFKDLRNMHVILDVVKYMTEMGGMYEAASNEDEADLLEAPFYDLNMQLSDMNNIKYDINTNACILNSQTEILKARFKYLYEKFTAPNDLAIKEFPKNLLVAALQNGKFQQSWLLPVTSDLRKLYDIKENAKTKKNNIVFYDKLQGVLQEWQTSSKNNKVFTSLPFLKDAPFFLDPKQKEQRVDYNVSKYEKVTAVLENIPELKVIGTAGRPVKNVLQEYLQDDTADKSQMTLQGFLTLPNNVQYFSLINLPGTELLTRTNLSKSYLNSWQFLNAGKYDYNKWNRETTYFKFLEKSFLTPLKYFQEKNNLANLQLFIQGNRSLVKCLEYLAPYEFHENENIQKDLHQEITAFLNKSISSYTTTVSKQKQNEKTKVPSLAKSSFFSEALTRDYKLGVTTNSEVLNALTRADQCAVFATMGLEDGVYVDVDVDLSATDTTTRLSENDDEDIATCKTQYKIIAKRYYNLHDLQEDNNKNDLLYDTEYDTSYYDNFAKYKLGSIKKEEDRLEELTKQLMQTDLFMAKPTAIKEAEDILNNKKKKIVQEGDYAILQEKPTDSDPEPASSEPASSITYYIRRGTLWEKEDMESTTNSDKASDICNENVGFTTDEPPCLTLKQTCLPGTKVITLLAAEADKKQKAEVSTQKRSYRQDYTTAKAELSALLRMRKGKMFANDKRNVLMAGNLLFQGKGVSPYQAEIDAILGLENDEALYQCIMVLFKYTRPAHSKSEDNNWFYLNEPLETYQVIPVFKVTLAKLFTEKKFQEYKSEYNRIQKEECEEKNNEWVHKATQIRLGPVNFVRASNEYDYVNGDLEDADEDADSGPEDDADVDADEDMNINDLGMDINTSIDSILDEDEEEEEEEQEEEQDQDQDFGQVEREQASLVPAPIYETADEIADETADETAEAQKWSDLGSTLKKKTTSYFTYDYINYTDNLEAKFRLLASEKLRLYEIISAKKKSLKDDIVTKAVLWYRGMVINGILYLKHKSNDDQQQELNQIYNNHYAKQEQAALSLEFLKSINNDYFVLAIKETKSARKVTTSITTSRWSQFKPPLQKVSIKTTPAMPTSINNVSKTNLLEFSYKIISNIEDTICGKKNKDLLLNATVLQNACLANLTTATITTLNQQASVLSQQLQQQSAYMRTKFYQVVPENESTKESAEESMHNSNEFSEETKMKYISYQCSLGENNPFPPHLGSEQFMLNMFGSTAKVNISSADEDSFKTNAIPNFPLLLRDVNNQNIIDLVTRPVDKTILLPTAIIVSDSDAIYKSIIQLLNNPSIIVDQNVFTKLNDTIALAKKQVLNKLKRSFPEMQGNNKILWQKLKSLTAAGKNQAQVITSAVKFITRQLPNLFLSKEQNDIKVPVHWKLQEKTMTAFMLEKMSEVKQHLHENEPQIAPEKLQDFISNNQQLLTIAQALLSSVYFSQLEEQFYTFVLHDTLLRLAVVDTPFVPIVVEILCDYYLLPDTGYSYNQLLYAELLDKINTQKETEKEAYLQKRNKRTVEEIKVDKMMRKIMQKYDARS